MIFPTLLNPFSKEAQVISIYDIDFELGMETLPCTLPGSILTFIPNLHWLCRTSIDPAIQKQPYYLQRHGLYEEYMDRDDLE